MLCTIYNGPEHVLNMSWTCPEHALNYVCDIKWYNDMKYVWYMLKYSCICKMIQRSGYMHDIWINDDLGKMS